MSHDSTATAASALTPALRRRAQLLIFIAIMATGLGQTVVFAVLGPLGREVALNELQIGIVITCSSIVFSLFSPMWGRRSDRVGRASTMVTGLLGYTAGTVLFATTFWIGTWTCTPAPTITLPLPKALAPRLRPPN